MSARPTITQRVAVALHEDLLERGLNREDAASVIRRRWCGLDLDEPDEFWEELGR